MTDAKDMAAMMLVILKSVCRVWVQKLKVWPMNLSFISSKLVMFLPTFNMSEQSTHTTSLRINVLTSPPPVSRKNKGARDMQRWRDGFFFWGGGDSCRC